LGLGMTDSELPLEKIDLVSFESILYIMVSVCPSKLNAMPTVGQFRSEDASNSELTQPTCGTETAYCSLCQSSELDCYSNETFCLMEETSKDNQSSSDYSTKVSL
jgi:hypothetical protein